jgi:hypothetical protein
MRLTCAVAGLAGLRIGVGPCADKPRVVLLNDVAATWTLLPEERELVDAHRRRLDLFRQTPGRELLRDTRLIPLGWPASASASGSTR